MSQPNTLLRIDDHSRASAGMTYVYPVVSRRARGVSIGINLNPNNACNWRCIYCQVPNLKRGGPPPIDLEQLRDELCAMLREVLHGAFMEQRVPAEARRLMDVAFSGNGEPTTAKEFPAAVDIAIETMKTAGPLARVPIRLITNGSQLDRRPVQQGIARLGAAGGEVWFKLDAGNPERISRINNSRTTLAAVERRLSHCAALCPTWIQTCLLEVDGSPMTDEDVEDYVKVVTRHAREIRGVHLYGLARSSTQPEAARLRKVSPQRMEALAARLRNEGLTVTVNS